MADKLQTAMELAEEWHMQLTNYAASTFTYWRNRAKEDADELSVHNAKLLPALKVLVEAGQAIVYPSTEQGIAAAVAVRLCAAELRAWVQAWDAALPNRAEALATVDYVRERVLGVPSEKVLGLAQKQK